MRFLCDQMFGTLAKWLRLCGFDTFYKKEEINDNELLQIASAETRVILSRDRELIQRAVKKQIPAYYIQSRDISSQLYETFSKSNQQINAEKILTRCSVCNHLLTSVDKEKIIVNIPPKVAESRQSFWQCDSCKRIYWQGTHYEKITQAIQKIIKEESK